MLRLFPWTERGLRLLQAEGSVRRAAAALRPCTLCIMGGSVRATRMASMKRCCSRRGRREAPVLPPYTAGPPSGERPAG